MSAVAPLAGLKEGEKVLWYGKRSLVSYLGRIIARVPQEQDSLAWTLLALTTLCLVRGTAINAKDEYLKGQK